MPTPPSCATSTRPRSPRCTPNCRQRRIALKAEQKGRRNDELFSTAGLSSATCSAVASRAAACSVRCSARPAPPPARPHRCLRRTASCCQEQDQAAATGWKTSQPTSRRRSPTSTKWMNGEGHHHRADPLEKSDVKVTQLYPGLDPGSPDQGRAPPAWRGLRVHRDLTAHVAVRGCAGHRLASNCAGWWVCARSPPFPDRPRVEVLARRQRHLWLRGVPTGVSVPRDEHIRTAAGMRRRRAARLGETGCAGVRRRLSDRRRRPAATCSGRRGCRATLGHRVGGRPGAADA